MSATNETEILEKVFTTMDKFPLSSAHISSAKETIDKLVSRRRAQGFSLELVDFGCEKAMVICGIASPPHMWVKLKFTKGEEESYEALELALPPEDNDEAQ